MIHVLGNAAIDTLLRVDTFPRPGETIVARGALEDLGGKGVNQAIVLARCGQEVRLAAALGGDAAGERIRNILAAEGIRLDGIHVWGGATDRCVITVDRDGENMIVSLVDAAAHFDPLACGSIGPEVAHGDWMLLQGNLSPAITRACLAFARRAGTVAALNPSPTYPAAEYDWRLVDLVVLNRVEAVALGGRSDPIEAGGALRAAGAGTVVVTLGAEGAALLSETGVLWAQAPPTNVVDTTGAGDAFCGVLIAARASGSSWKRALRVACEAATICVSRLGVRASFPTRAEITAIFERATEPST